MSPTDKALLLFTIGAVIWTLYDDPRCLQWIRDFLLRSRL